MLEASVEKSFDTCFDHERKHIESGRQVRLGENADKLPWCGIGLSGGGIRSACLALGVLQVLAGHRLLERFDYISTVSGGGYIGTSLQWWWAKIKRDDAPIKPLPTFGLGPDDFPYGPAKPPAKYTPSNATAARAYKNLEFLRTHASYLTPGNGLSVWSMLVVLFRTITISILIWLPVVAAFLAGLHLLDQTIFNRLAISMKLWPPLGDVIPAYWDTKAALDCAGQAECDFRLRAIYAFLIYCFYAIAILFGLVSVVYGFLSRTPQETESPKNMKRSAAVAVVMLVAASIWPALGVASIDAVAAAVLFLIGLLSLTVLVRILAETTTEPSVNASYWLRRGVEKRLGQFFLPSMTILAIGLIPLIPHYLWKFAAPTGGFAGIVSLLSGITTAIYGYYTFVRNIVPSLAARIVATFGAALYLYGTLVLAYWLSIAVASDPDIIANSRLFVHALSLILLAIALFLGFIANINYVGLHRFYRDRLMEAFMPNDRSVEYNRSGRSAVADSLSVDKILSSSADDPNDPTFMPKPYPLINANVILVNDDYPKFAARGGANFLISPLYVGSSATGWQSTPDYIASNGPLTLATSMAASGAAASASAGYIGTGITMNPLVSAVMSLLNIRLGVWLGNPTARRERKLRSIPTFFNPGFLAGVLGLGHTRLSNYIELTDGGHFENLAMYELVRRKLNLIIVIDGEADPTISLASLVSARNRIEQDFGAKLEFFKDQGPELLVMHPEKGYPLGVKYARSPFIVGQLTYCNGSQGTFVYIKSNTTPTIDFSVAGYLASNPDFPHQATADQFFGPDQFEAYRNLGVESANLMVDALRLPACIARPEMIVDTYKKEGPRI